MKICLSSPRIMHEGGTLVIVKRSRFLAELIRHTLAPAFPGMEILVFERGGEALAHLRDRPATLLVSGLTLPDIDGLDLLAVLGRERLADHLLVVSDRKDERARTMLRTLTIRGYFDCGVETPSTLVHAAQCVAAGGTYVSSSLYAATPQASGATLQRVLTPTQLRVFAMIGDGSDDVSAGQRLRLQPNTVQSHRRDIMRKLGVQSRGELVKAAWRYGLVRLGENGRVLRPGFDWPAGVRPLSAGETERTGPAIQVVISSGFGAA